MQKQRNQLTKVCILIAVGSAGLGCSGNGAADEALGSSDQGLYLTATKWPGGNVPVCWAPATVARPNFALESRTLRDHANDSWPTVANVDLTGWTVCGADPKGMLRITLTDTLEGSSGLGYSAAAPTDLRIGVARMNESRAAVAQLVGGALGFNHEFARPDFNDGPIGTFPCAGPNVTGGNTVDTAADNQSILVATGLCNRNSTLSLWDVIGAQKAYGARATQVTPLRTGLLTYDYATVATATGVDSLNSRSYKWTFAEGWIFNQQVPGTVPLELYYHDATQDHFSTATTDGQQSAIAAGYRLVRTEGYVFSSAGVAGLVPLMTYYSPAADGFADNMLVTPGPSEQRAKQAGYRLIRIEGYIPRERPYSLVWTYWNAAREDNLATKQNSRLSGDAQAAAYDFYGFDGAVWRFPFQGTTPFKNYYSAARGDHFGLATSTSQNDAVAAGYISIANEDTSSQGASAPGYVYSSEVAGMAPMKSFYNDARGDHFTTISRSSTATAFGYRLIRTEGWGLNIND